MAKMGGNKYHNKHVECDGIRFDSKGERNRWLELKMLEKAGKIKDLERQVTYCFPQVKEPGFKKPPSARYDFRYFDIERNKLIVEDFKGYKNPADPVTRLYELKRGLTKHFYGVEVEEVTG